MLTETVTVLSPVFTLKVPWYRLASAPVRVIVPAFAKLPAVRLSQETSV